MFAFVRNLFVGIVATVLFIPAVVVLFVLGLVALITGSLALGALAVVAGLVLFVLKVALVVVLPLWFLGWVVTGALGWHRPRNRITA